MTISDNNGDLVYLFCNNNYMFYQGKEQFSSQKPSQVDWGAKSKFSKIYYNI